MQRLCVFLPALFLALAALAPAAENANAVRTVRAGVFVNPPFVMEKGGGHYEGMAVDLWNEVAEELRLHTEFVPFHNLHVMLESLRDGRIDVVVDNLAATHERAQYLKFSYPWYDSGQRIMVNSEAEASLWSALRKYRHFRVYAVFMLIFLALALIMTLIRRRREPDFPRDWKTGLAQCFYNVLDSAVNGKLNQRHLGWPGNLFFVAWLLFGVGAVAYFTSTMTSAMTGMKLTGDISQPADLPGKRVGVIEGSAAEDYFVSLKAPVRTFPELDDAVSELVAKKLDAVVMDAPALEYYEHNHPGLPLEVVGDVFHPERYCFASGYGHSELMDEVTVELIRLREVNRIAGIRDRYFADAGEEEEGLPWPSEN